MLVVAAASVVVDRAAGLDRDAEDYLLKPLNTDDLVARVDAALHQDPPRRS